MRDRYPNEDVERFDQQFAESEDERNERLRRKRLSRIALQRSEETHGEFSLFWWDPEGNQHTELQFVDAGRAVERAGTLSRGLAAKLGMVRRIIITDGGDCINFEWKADEGVTYPPERKGWR